MAQQQAVHKFVLETKNWKEKLLSFSMTRAGIVSQISLVKNVM